MKPCISKHETLYIYIMDIAIVHLELAARGVNRGVWRLWLINGVINYRRLLPGVEWANIYHSYNLKDHLSRYLLRS